MPEVVAPQPRVHGAARAASADFTYSAGGKSLSAVKFYSEYHGHRVGDLQVLLPALRPRAVTWLVGDSSLDNKHWLFDARRDGSDSTPLPLCAAARSKWWPLGSATARQPRPPRADSGRSTDERRAHIVLIRGSAATTVIARQSLSSRGLHPAQVPGYPNPDPDPNPHPHQVPATKRC